MKIAILSDIHDHIANLKRSLDEIHQAGIGTIIFCGDMCAPFTAQKLGEARIPTFACLGNVDEDHIRMLQKGGDNINWTALSQEYGHVELDNKKIAYCHYPKLAELLAKSGEYDAVFHGHTHIARDEKFGNSILGNPGAICGIQEGRYEKASWGMYDTVSNNFEIVNIN